MIEEMSAERFLPRDWDCFCWSSIGLSWSEMTDGESYCVCPKYAGAKRSKGDMLIRHLNKYAIGWCDGSRLTVRPRPETCGIMCETTDGVRFWFHIQRKTLDRLLKFQKKNEGI